MTQPLDSVVFIQREKSTSQLSADFLLDDEGDESGIIKGAILADARILENRALDVQKLAH